MQDALIFRSTGGDGGARRPYRNLAMNLCDEGGAVSAQETLMQAYCFTEPAGESAVAMLTAVGATGCTNTCQSALAARVLVVRIGVEYWNHKPAAH